MDNKIKSQNNKEKEMILKPATEKREFTYIGMSLGLTADFSTATTQSRRQGNDLLF